MSMIWREHGNSWMIMTGRLIGGVAGDIDLKWQN